MATATLVTEHGVREFGRARGRWGHYRNTYPFSGWSVVFLRRRHPAGGDSYFLPDASGFRFRKQDVI